MAINKWKHAPITREYEARVKKLLKGELKRQGITYGQLAERLVAIGVDETARNLTNKISRGGFTAAFLLQCLIAIGSRGIQLDDPAHHRSSQND